MIQHIRITHIKKDTHINTYINIYIKSAGAVILRAFLKSAKKTNKKCASLVMDLAVAWYQEEQEGEAKRIWSNIWETAEMVNKRNLFIYFRGIAN